MGYWSNKRRIIIISLGYLLTFGIAFQSPSYAGERVYRWTGQEDRDGTINHVLKIMSQKMNHALNDQDFILQEDRDLGFSHYQRWAQTIDHVPIHGKSIRIWTELNKGKMIQVEANLEPPHSQYATNGLSMLSRLGKSANQLRSDLTSEETHALIQSSVALDADDPWIRGMDWKDEWQNGELYRNVTVRGKHGKHILRINLRNKKVEFHRYHDFPQIDVDSEDSDLSINAQVYPIYEEDESSHTLLPRKGVALKHIKTTIPKVDGDIYSSLKKQHYYSSKFDPSLGLTEAGRAKGYWSMSFLKDEGQKIRDALPQVANNWSNGVLLQGKYATINIHPDAIQKYNPRTFQPRYSAAFLPNWIDSPNGGEGGQEMIPMLAYFGKPLQSPDEAWNRVARRLPDHDPAGYLEDGFDEIQVYYAINTLFDALHARGFKDPELSTRPFNAFLFNPDIAYRDNAFYTDDTINFTTYSSKAQNYARDNSTIWHELGHGVMDRLMGDLIELADTGGLSEGMADFIAAMVIQDVTQGVPFPGSQKFRIINKTGFNLTNEVHDDGEAYGGAMKDFMDEVIRVDGLTGLNKVADLILETMRLTRDYPGLTASEWFKHMLFADQLGRSGVRHSEELKPFILKALANRNFQMDGGKSASFSLVNRATEQEILAGSPGSRDVPITVKIAPTETAKFQLQAGVSNSNTYQFKFPLRVQVQFEGGPLEGAIHWIGKEKGPQFYTLTSEQDRVTIPIEASGKCDEVNRSDGSCVDYVYVKVLNPVDPENPLAKKRFYLRIKNS